ncbi:hypothetical protein GALMADRAFT_273588 [Galerina marginata CBS 339.88]|uniref:Uncharacterized protein n=1 Tax=Galerina marginata (strain CBS 339.88) TaxID=685588 RepID=A0A067S6L3_GALM3|nr:hypothetical protein GALMADRAFT_273588 [Galerina marginata CBS 339.88]
MRAFVCYAKAWALLRAASHYGSSTQAEFVPSPPLKRFYLENALAKVLHLREFVSYFPSLSLCSSEKKFGHI